MNKLLQVLNIEDSVRDVALLNRHLTRAGYEVVSMRVETPEAMRAALEAQEWDLILCDYSMPHFSALAALELLKKIELDIPFIIISGTVGEDVAVKAMRGGAHDYLMKDNLTRLVPTIEREINEAENRRARRRAEEALKASEAELRTLFAAMTDIIAVFDAEGRYQKIAPTNPSFLYKPSGDLIGKTLHETLPKEDADFLLKHIHRTLEEEGTRKIEYSLQFNGTEVWFDASVLPMSENSVVLIARDITERKHAEDRLRKSEKRYRLLFESNPQPMWVYDTETLAFIEVNNAAVHHYGYSREEFLSMTIKDIRPAEDIPKLLDSVLEGGDRFNAAVWHHRKKDGTVINVEISSDSLTFQGRKARLVMANDITERRALEEQLRQSQKLESIGLLAGGIAHDFNNLLTAINGYSELGLRKLKPEDALRHNFEEIKKASDRATGLTRQLLAFSRKQVLKPKILDLNEVISEIEKMLRRLIGEDIELSAALDSRLGSVKADPGQIEQVIMNLVVNARDAMPDGGRIIIETKNVYLDEEYAKRHIAVNAGHYVMLAVSDTGIGMDSETQKRIFEPFFTTKEVGKGTGLGLSTIYGIVKQSGGNIWIYSEVGRGSSFKIYLPRVDEAAREYKEVTELEKEIQGAETILLAEDEEVVRKLALEVLLSYGYKVLEAENGKTALSICESQGESIDLLITDVVMPEMGGRELAARLLKRCPDVKVLYMSGYTDDAVIRQGEIKEGSNFIQKPFSLEALVQKVREVLDA